MTFQPTNAQFRESALQKALEWSNTRAKEAEYHPGVGDILEAAEKFLGFLTAPAKAPTRKTEE